MKYIYKINTILIALILAFININNANAQTFVPAITNDSPADNSVYNVENTGNDIMLFENAFFQVSVWDGDVAKLGWDPSGADAEPAITLDGNQYGYVSDPDVVLQIAQNRLYAFVIYTVAGRLYYEVHEFYQGNHLLYIPATQIGTAVNCKNPNLDIDNYNHLAAVWTEGNDIKVAYSNIFFNNPIFKTALSGSGARNPDVAVFFNNNNSATNPVTMITANQTDATYEYTVSLRNTGWNNGTFSGIYKFEVKKPGFFGRPRIAAYISNSTNEYFEFVAIKHESNSSINTVLGCNIINGNPSSASTLNPSLEHDYNVDPAISFINNTISVIWTHESSFSNNKDIIQQKLNTSGAIVNPTNTFQVVNMQTSAEQIVASVSGRHSSGARASYCFFDNLYNELSYKKSLIGNSSIRRGITVNKARLSPNPASSIFEINLSEEVETADIIIYDIQGKIVQRDYYTPYHKQYNISNLAKGSYIIKINSVFNSFVERLIIN